MQCLFGWVFSLLLWSESCVFLFFGLDREEVEFRSLLRSCVTRSSVGRLAPEDMSFGIRSVANCKCFWPAGVRWMFSRPADVERMLFRYIVGGSVRVVDPGEVPSPGRCGR